MKRTPAKRRSEICMTVQKDDVFVFGNPEAFRRMAEYMVWLAGSKPSEHYHMHVTWHLASHRSKRHAVFVLASPEARRLHRPKRFELTFMVLEPRDFAKLRHHERSGRLPRKFWQTPGEASNTRAVSRSRRSGALGRRGSIKEQSFRRRR